MTLVFIGKDLLLEAKRRTTGFQVYRLSVKFQLPCLFLVVKGLKFQTRMEDSGTPITYLYIMLIS